MAEAKFDPYHAWLGIPAWDRPVNAYRLLGIEVFEENRKVIEAAANRQMAYLQELSSGDEHIEEAQKLLGQVSKARVVLLNPEKKAAYDKKLSEQLDSLPEAAGHEGGDKRGDGATVVVSERLAANPAKGSSRNVERIKLGILLIVILTAVAVYLFVRPTYLEVYAVNENGDLIAGLPFTEFSPKEQEEFSNVPDPILTKEKKPALFLLSDFEQEEEIYVSEYNIWPNKFTPYEIIGEGNRQSEKEGKEPAKLGAQKFVKSSWPYLVNPSITWEFKKIKPRVVSATLKGSTDGAGYVIMLDSSGVAIPDEIGTEIPYPLNPQTVFRVVALDQSGDDKRLFSTNKAYFRTTDRPNVKILRISDKAHATVFAISETIESPDKVNAVAIQLNSSEKYTKDTTAEKKSEEKKTSIAKGPITVSGQVKAEDRNGQLVGIESFIKLDLDDNGKITQSEIRFRTRTGEEGNFKLGPFTPLQGTAPSLRVDKIKGFDQLDPVAIALDKVGNGKIVVEIPLLTRETITISGRVKAEPAAEFEEGFILFMDRNENGEPDEGEPRATTDTDGNYKFQLPFFIDDYMKDGTNSLDLLVVNAPTDTRDNIVIDRDTRNLDIDWPKAIREANFVASEKEVEIAMKDDPSTDGINKENGNDFAPPPDPETDSKIFLESLGFSGDVPTEGSETKPEWTFNTNAELVEHFNTVKIEYDRAEKKQNWKNKIPQLELARKSNDEKIKSILTSAKSESAKKRAALQIQPYNNANKQIDNELAPLLESRTRLLISINDAANKIEQEQTAYLYAKEQEEQVHKAAKTLGVTLQILDKPPAAWQPAIKYLAENKLRTLGLQKQGRKWIPTDVAQEAAILAQIKQFAQQNFKGYVNKKKQLELLIGQNNPANNSKIERIEKQIEYEVRGSKYKNAKTTFDSNSKKYLELLSRLQTQRQELENNKDDLEKIIGGDKKYKTILNQYPKDEVIVEKQTFITTLQQMVQ